MTWPRGPATGVSPSASIVAPIALACAAWCVTARVAAQSPQPTFRAGVELVRIDVVVVDAEGRAVHGLTKDDFVVLDKQKPQTVAVVDEISHERPPAPILPPTLKLDVADNATAKSDRLIILILDDLRFYKDKTDDIKTMARRVVEDIGPGASLGLVTTSGSFGIEPTEDRAQLLDEIDRFVDKFDPEGRRMARGTFIPADQGPGPAGATSIAAFFADMTQRRKLADVAKMLGGDDGRRKAFVWLTGGAEGATKGDPWHPDGYWLREQAAMLNSMRKANVTAYSVTVGDFSPSMLKVVAEETGGFVIRQEDFDREIGRLMDDLDHYYLVGFHPDDPKDKSYHPLDIRVNRPGLTVRARRGYQLVDGPAKPKNAEPLKQLLEGVLPKTDLRLRFGAVALPPSGQEGTRFAFTLEVRADSAPLEEADGNLRDQISYTVWAVDMNKKKPTANVAREVHLSLSADSDRRAVVYEVQSILALPPGRYQLRASATSAKMKIGGSVYLDVDMPDFRRNDVELGGIAIGYLDGSRVPIVGTPLSKDTLAVSPTLDRELSREDTLRAVCDVARKNGLAADVKVDLLDASGALVKLIDQRQLSGATASRIDVVLALKELAPGGYRLRVSATGGDSAVERELGFIVR